MSSTTPPVSARRVALGAALCALAFAAAACTTPPPQKPDPKPAQKVETPKPKPIKNIILMIGDGMGPQQVGLLQEYAGRAPRSIYGDKPTAIAQMMDAGVVGLSQHGPMDRIVVDSACSATQLATGKPAPSEVIGLDAKGDPAQTVLEQAKSMGKATGLVSDTRLTHATPASFAAHVAHRSMENTIAEQMLATGVDVMLSGGLRHWIPKSATDAKSDAHKAIKAQVGDHIRLKSKRKDERNLLNEAKAAGYSLAFDRDALKAASGGKLLGLFSYSGMADGITTTKTLDDPKRREPTLEEMTVKALDTLSQDPDGFFLMVEGGQIDWAGHGNDVGTMLHEMIKFDRAIGAVHAWAKDRDDTLVVITADHETGGFGFSYSRANIPAPSKLPGAGFKDQPYAPNFNFGPLSSLDRIYAQKMSFFNILRSFDEGKDKSPKALMELVNTHTAFSISPKQAEAILARERNAYRKENHPYLSAETFPKVDDFEAFYVYGDDIRTDLLGRALATQQNVVWATGTHTHTPVAVIALGPEDYTRRFDGLLHHTTIGQLLQGAWSR